MLQLTLLVITLIARAVDPSACGVAGVWHEPTMGFTTRIEGARWQTWSGGPVVDERTAPAGQGWVEHTESETIFGYEGSRTGYRYSPVFDGCDALSLSLLPTGQQLHLQRVTER